MSTGGAPPGEPVADHDLGLLFDAPFAAARRIGVAVSGGPDSTALLHLLDRWARRRPDPPDLHVLTVDHGLRPGARAEAEAVLALAARLGRAADLLVWHHPDGPPAADLQAAARAARYRLLAEAAGRHRLDAIALGHTLDDQAETLLIRLARGSGVWGLAGMRPDRRIGDLRLVRPLLALPKARLLATLAAAGLGYTEDPANAADRFLRARIRRLAPDLAAVGLGPDRLAGTARRLARAAEALDRMVETLETEALVDHGGVLAVDAARLAAAPDEIALRVIARAVRRIRPDAYPPRAAPLESWHDRFRTAPHSLRRRTLAGVVLDLRRERLWIYAEAGRAGFPILEIRDPGRWLWDGRFAVEVDGRPAGPLRVVPAEGEARRPDLPRAAAGSLPVFALGDTRLPPGRHRLGTLALALLPVGAGPDDPDPLAEA